MRSEEASLRRPARRARGDASGDPSNRSAADFERARAGDGGLPGGRGLRGRLPAGGPPGGTGRRGRRVAGGGHQPCGSGPAGRAARRSDWGAVGSGGSRINQQGPARGRAARSRSGAVRQQRGCEVASGHGPVPGRRTFPERDPRAPDGGRTAPPPARMKPNVRPAGLFSGRRSRGDRPRSASVCVGGPYHQRTRAGRACRTGRHLPAWRASAIGARPERRHMPQLARRRRRPDRGRGRAWRPAPSSARSRVSTEAFGRPRLRRRGPERLQPRGPAKGRGGATAGAGPHQGRRTSRRRPQRGVKAAAAWLTALRPPLPRRCRAAGRRR